MKKIIFALFILSLQAKAQTCLTYTQMLQASNPCSVCSADLNGDGFKDLVSANHNSNNVIILLGNGNGQFTPDSSFAVGVDPYSVITEDLNGDGFKDLATANYNSGTVSVLLGMGNGIFNAATNYTVASIPRCIVSADLNNDGFKDLVTANSSSAGTISVLLGNGTGSFGAGSTYYASGLNYPWSLVSTDFNGDGNTDLAVANSSGATSCVSVLLGAGTGAFTTSSNFPVGDHPLSVITADFNGDGKADLLTANQTGKNISVLLGTGTGSFGTATNFSLGTFQDAISVVGADMNGDSKTDVAVANYSDHSVSVLLGNGAGGFAVDTNITLWGNPWIITSGDFNGDNLADLAVADYGSEVVDVLLSCNNSGIGHFSNNELIYVYPNPASDFLSISVAGTEDYSAELYDMNGRLLLYNARVGTSQLDIRNLDNGIYTLKIKNSEGIANRKLIIAH